MSSKQTAKGVNEEVKNEEKEIIKLPKNEMIWELSQNKEENEDYDQLRSSLLSKIKKCHAILYNVSVCGRKHKMILCVYYHLYY